MKIVYKLRDEGLTIRQIKKEAKNKYKLDIFEKDIRDIAVKIVTRKIKYTNVDKRKILYLYENYYNTQILIEYLNSKYGYDLTYSKIIDLASRNGILPRIINH